MDQNQAVLTLEESIKQVMQTLPPVIRNYLQQEKYSVVVQSLMSKHNLHPDQENILEREILLLLMGVDNPDEFSEALVTEAGLSQQIVNTIMQDVNTQIFIPLRAQMQSGGGNPGQPIRRPVMPPVPQPRVAPSVSNYAPQPAMYAPVVPPPPPVFRPAPRVSEMPPPSVIIQANPSLPMRPAQAAASMMRRMPLPPRPIMPPKPFVPRVATPSSPNQQKPAGAPMVLEDHEEPSPSLHQAPRVSPILPTGFKPPVPTQRVYTPPSNLPGAMLSSAPRPIPPPPPSSTPPPVPLTPKPPVEPYSSDPYREPVDESPAE